MSVEKIITIQNLSNLEINRRQKTVGLCHGGFDFIHPGHVQHFESASKICDLLIVSVTSDEFISKRKGKYRPIYNQNERLYVLSSLEYIDYVILSPFNTAKEIIELIKPDFYIKGPDYQYKNTEGINKERQYIDRIGGQIRYTNDKKYSTSNLIDKIKFISRPSLLLIADRDGTLIEDKHFLEKNMNWLDNIILRRDVIDFIHFLMQHYEVTIIGITNQSGVAHKYFSEEKVIMTHDIISQNLEKEGILINNWQYSPNVDYHYALGKGLNNFDEKYIKRKSDRKPSTAMVEKAMKHISMNINSFNYCLVIGDRKEDKMLAYNLNALFIDVNKKNYTEIKNFFLDHVTK